jgi:hypothetical protein
VDDAVLPKENEFSTVEKVRSRHVTSRQTADVKSKNIRHKHEKNCQPQLFSSKIVELNTSHLQIKKHPPCLLVDQSTRLIDIQ